MAYQPEQQTVAHPASSTINECEPNLILHSTNIGSDELKISSPDLYVTDPLLHAHVETVTLVQEWVNEPHLQSESGQLEASTPTGLRTPANSMEGILTNSLFVDGKRRSARANYSYTADGTPAADELVLDKAKRRAAIRNLDSPAATTSKGADAAYSAGKPLTTSRVDIQKDKCIANLNYIGISSGNNTNAINVSYNALKRVEVDRVTVQPKLKGTGRACFKFNPLDLNDEEDCENDCGLLSQLVKEVTDMDLDDLDLATRICDLKSPVVNPNLRLKRIRHAKGSRN